MLVFPGVFCLKTKSRLPPDAASVAPTVDPKCDSGRDAVVVLDDPAAAGDAANIAGLEAGDDFLRSGLRTSISRQRAIPQGLMRSLVVEVVDVLPERDPQSAVVQEAAPAHEFVLRGRVHRVGQVGYPAWIRNPAAAAVGIAA